MPADRCRVPQAFWRAVEYLGVHPTAVLRQAQLPVTLHENAQQLVTTAELFAIWEAIAAVANDSAFGIKLIEASRVKGHQPLFLAALYAESYRDGLTRIARFKRFASPERILIEEEKGEALIRREWYYAAGAEPLISVDVSFAYLVALGRLGTGQHLKPVRVEYARLDSVSRLHREYFDCPIVLGAPRNLLVLSSADLERPFPGRNLEFLELIMPALKALLGVSGSDVTISELVKTVLKRRLASGRPEVAIVAADLRTTERTLQRRMADEGTTFRDLLAEARKELCRALLADASLEDDDVACLLGYQDTKSFYRAFRDWEGVTPSQWRNRLSPSDGKESPP